MKSGRNLLEHYEAKIQKDLPRVRKVIKAIEELRKLDPALAGELEKQMRQKVIDQLRQRNPKLTEVEAGDIADTVNAVAKGEPVPDNAFTRS